VGGRIGALGCLKWRREWEGEGGEGGGSPVPRVDGCKVDQVVVWWGRGAYKVSEFGIV